MEISKKRIHSVALMGFCLLFFVAAEGDGAEKTFKKSRLTADKSEGVADRRKLLLATGEDKAVDLDFEVAGGAGGINVGNPAIVGVTLVKIGEKRQLVFKPLKDGNTNITIRDPDGTIRLIFQVSVAKSNMLRISGEIRELLRDIEGLEIRIVGQKVILDGEILVPMDYARLVSVITDKVYEPWVINLTTLSPLALQVLSKKMEQDIQAFAPDVKTRVVNNMIFLEGTVDGPDKAKRALELAKLYLPEAKPGNPLLAKDGNAQSVTRSTIQSFIMVNAPPPRKQEKLVRITFHFVKLQKDYLRQFGFKWSPSFKADGDAVSFGTTDTHPNFTATIGSLIPRLQTAQNAGYARVLKTGTVIVRSGQQGEVSEMTNFPYLTVNANGQTTAASTPVGVVMKVKPQILGQSEDIELNMSLSQTSLASKPLANAQPMTSKHDVTTNLYVKSDESAAVAGVNSTDIQTLFNKDDPKEGTFQNGAEPLFSFVRSRNFGKNKSEFVVFVTPQIIENASDGTEDLKKNFRVKVK